jgi:hypothetical protein
VETGFPKGHAINKEHVPEKWKPVFRKGHAINKEHVPEKWKPAPEKWKPAFRKGMRLAKSMPRKSGSRFSEKDMRLANESRADPDSI